MLNHRKKSPVLVGTDLKDPLLIQAPSNLALKTSRDGAATTSLRNVFSVLQHHHSKKFFPNI